MTGAVAAHCNTKEAQSFKMKLKTSLMAKVTMGMNKALSIKKV